MNPKKANKIFEEYALQNNLDPDLVQDLMDYYWAELRKAVSDLKYPRINVENLGILDIRLRPLENTILRYERYKKTVPYSEFKKYTLHSKITQRIEQLNTLRDIINDESERKKNFKTNKNEQSNQDMETQGSDS